MRVMMTIQTIEYKLYCCIYLQRIALKILIFQIIIRKKNYFNKTYIVCQKKRIRIATNYLEQIDKTVSEMVKFKRDFKHRCY